MEINIFLRFEVLFLSLLVLPSLQQLFIGTITVQHHQLDVIACLLLGRCNEFLQSLPAHQ
jgi:hypothetical protein